MKSSIRISIPTPCHEKWSDFTPVSGGGFCSACQKNVIDFTRLSDEEILRHISGASGKVCGRFRGDQLNTDYIARELVRIPPGVSLLKAGVIGLFLMLLSKPATAQERKQKQRTEVVQEEQKAQTSSRPADDEKYWVKGVIRDKYDNSPIPGANVLLKGTTHGTVTDVNGSFNFPVQLKKGDILLVSFIGYMTEDCKIPTATGETLVLNLTLNYDIMGEIAVEGLYKPKKTVWSLIRNLF